MILRYPHRMLAPAMPHLPPHSLRGHPRGNEPGRCASGAVSNGIRHPHPGEDPHASAYLATRDED